MPLLHINGILKPCLEQPVQDSLATENLFNISKKTSYIFLLILLTADLSINTKCILCLFLNFTNSRPFD